MSKKTKIFLIVFFVCAVLSFVISISTAATQKQSGNPFLGGFSTKQVGVVRIEEIIMESADFVKEINDFRDDINTAAILLRIDSPGGSVAPSQEIYYAVKKCAEKKPIIVSMGSVAASGGYYIASGANKIFANGGTLTGSIGVIMQFPKYAELLNKIGISIETIKAGKMKDAGSPVRELTAEERKYFDDLLKDTHEQFIKDVAAGRKMEYDYIKTLAEGRIYTGNQALELGLVDNLGTFDDAKNYILETYGLPKNTRFTENVNYRRFFRNLSLKTPIKNLFPIRKSGIYFIAEQLI
jgi:protease-4